MSDSLLLNHPFGQRVPSFFCVSCLNLRILTKYKGPLDGCRGETFVTRPTLAVVILAIVAVGCDVIVPLGD